jgi:hypothetical protein
LQSAIETQHYDVLETFLLTGKVADPNAALQVLKRRANSDPKITAWIEKFCDRFDFVEDLVAAYLKEGFSQLAFIKKLIEKVHYIMLNALYSARVTNSVNCLPV